jgi:hypothetical protein
MLARLLAPAQQRDHIGLGVPQISAADVGVAGPGIAVGEDDFRPTVYTCAAGP